MANFRRRKPGVAWLPHVAHDSQNPQIGYWYANIAVSATANTITTSVFALVPDYPAEAVRAAGALPTLSDFEASGFKLRRIVGKIFCGMENNQPATGTRTIAALVGAGFIVLKCEESTGAPLVTTANHYSPLDNDSTRDPWIWRRTWLLQNDFSGFDPNIQSTWQFPRTNCDYGSAVDGPHIDARTARRIGAEERLFFVISTQNISGTADDSGGVKMLLDYRILATPIRIMGNRRNASR